MLKKVKRIKLGKQIYGRLMKRVLERDGWRCQKCGSPENHSPACRFSESHAGTGVGFMAFRLTSYPNLRRVLTSF
jgi:hypothetical protein